MDLNRSLTKMASSLIKVFHFMNTKCFSTYYLKVMDKME